ncbi:MAG: hypothetical protein ACE5D7_03175, partial [Fidelibacterota bacterium]
MNFGTDVEPTILINPLSIDEVVVAWMYYGSPSHIEFASSSDNGDNWYRGNIPYTDSLGSADPSLAFTQDGKVHIIHLSDEISIISSGDIFTNNPTWNGPYEVSSSGDKPWLSSDLTSGDCSGNLYSTFSANLIKNKVSDDNSSTWSSIGIFDSVENVYPYWSTSIVNNCGTMFVF